MPAHSVGKRAEHATQREPIWTRSLYSLRPFDGPADLKSPRRREGHEVPATRFHDEPGF
jgi:hypothetical protein